MNLLFLMIRKYRSFPDAGKRRALIPPSVGYINETLKPIPEEVLRSLLFIFHNELATYVCPKMISHMCLWMQFGPRRSLLSHANEPLVFEIQLLKVL